MNDTNITTVLVFLVFTVIAWSLLGGMFDKKVSIIEESEAYAEGETEGFRTGCKCGSGCKCNENCTCGQDCRCTNCSMAHLERPSGYSIPNQGRANMMPNGGTDFMIRDINMRYKSKECPCGCPTGCQCGAGCNRCNCTPFFDVYQDSNIKANAHGTRSCPFDDGIDWSVNQEPGANCTHGDNVWHFVEPRMILKDNCLSCDKWEKGENYNPPVGLLNNLASQHDAGNEFSNQINGIIYDEFSSPSFHGAHTLSKPANTGIVPIKCDCAAKLATGDSCGDLQKIN